MSNVDNSRFHFNAIPTFEDRNEECKFILNKKR